MLLVAPFPASAGLRGGLLLLSAGALVALLIRTRTWTLIYLPSRMYMWAAALWIFSVALFSAVSPDPQTSLSGWRGNVLTPVLACVVFYLLTKDRRALIGFSAVLLIGLTALSAMVVQDPFGREDPFHTHTSLYGGVGRVSIWFATLAPLLPLVWFAPRRWRIVARAGCGVAVLAILVGTWYTGNRAAWVCYAAMLIVGAVAAFWSTEPRRISFRALIVLVSLLIISLAGFYASSIYRANLHTNNRDAPIEFLLKDNRAPIWRAAIQMIAEKPWTGHGYDLDSVGDNFTKRLSEPDLRDWIRHAHNVLLDYAIQMGVFAAAILAILFVTLFVEFWRLAASKRTERDQLARVAAICGMALVTGVFMRNMVDDFFSRHMVLLFGAVLGMLLGIANRGQR